MSLRSSEPVQGPTCLRSIHVYSPRNIKKISCQGSVALVSLYIGNLCQYHDPTSQSAAPNLRISAVTALVALVAYTQHPSILMPRAFDLRIVAGLHTYRSIKRLLTSLTTISSGFA